MKGNLKLILALNTKSSIFNNSVGCKFSLVNLKLMNVLEIQHDLNLKQQQNEKQMIKYEIKLSRLKSKLK